MPDVKISAVIPECRNRGSSTHLPLRNETTNDKRGRFPLFAVRRTGNDANLMGRFRRGFTLIELLVVVLIVGILAAVALPQYQKAVWRSRNAQLKTLVRAVAQAEQNYFLANGVYAGDFDELALDLPLSAPVQSGSTESVCGFAIRGTDAVRRGKNFELVLGGPASAPGRISVQAVWTDKPYKCTGFAWFSETEDIRCREKHNGSSTSSVGDFCEKIEKGTFYQQDGHWYYYQLP